MVSTHLNLNQSARHIGIIINYPPIFWGVKDKKMIENHEY